MDGTEFDRLTRGFARALPRRRFLAVVVAAAVGRRGANAQVQPAMCGSEGGVCTLLFGCCSGLRCATSAINASYGVCVPGDGGMLPVTTTVIAPFGNAVVQELTGAADEAANASSSTPSSNSSSTRKNSATDSTDASSSTTSDATTTESTTTESTGGGGRNGQRNGGRNRRARNRQRRNRSHDSNKKDDKKDKKKDDKNNKQDEPQLAFKLFHPGGDGGIEKVVVTNKTEEDVFLAKIVSRRSPSDSASLPPWKLAPGDSFSFVSDDTGLNTDKAEFGWISQPICSDQILGDGFVISAAFSADGNNTEYTVRCP